MATQTVINRSDVTITLKKGTGAGTYSSTSTTLTNVDGTNLSYTVTIPVGWKLAVSAVGSITSATTGVGVQLALADGGTQIPGTGILATPTAALQWIPFSLGTVITGDGASHTITLQYMTSNASDSVNIVNQTNFGVTLYPEMVFTLMPSN